MNQSMLAVVIERVGNEFEAVASWEHALTLAREIDDQAGLVSRARRHLAMLAFARGDYVYAQTLLQENLTFARDTGNTVGLYWSLAGLADLERLQKNYMQASAMCAEGLALAREIGDRYAMSRLLCIQGKIAQAQGERQQALTRYRDSLSLTTTIDAGNIAGHCLLGLVQESLTAGRFQQATSLFAAATSRLILTRQFAPSERTIYELNLADLRAQLDNTAFTDAWTEGETMTVQQVLALPFVRDNEEELCPRPHPVAAGPVSSDRQLRTSRYPAGLTAREVEVLRLVALGWTDAQIAQELVISARTVNAHLTSIYRKIRVSSRHAAAHYAQIQRLA